MSWREPESWRQQFCRQLARFRVAGGGGDDAERASERVGQVARPVYGGYALEGRVPQAFRIESPIDYACTASLVASNVILTAAHCTDTTLYHECGDDYAPQLGTYEAWIRNGLDGDKVHFLHEQGITTSWKVDANSSDALMVRYPYQHICDADADFALVRASTSISRCAMKPLRIVDVLPDPPWIPETAGTYLAWAGVNVEILGAGGVTSGCIGGGYPTALGFGSNILSVEAGLWRWQLGVFGGEGLAADGPHICPGDSGGPILVGLQDPFFGSNLNANHVGTQVGLTSTCPEDGEVFWAPLLHAERNWLREHALDAEDCDGDIGDGVESFEDNCDTVCNPGQEDSDGDGIGDGCDLAPGLDDCGDADGDGTSNGYDECPFCADDDSLEHGDSDDDGICDCEDMCPCDAHNDQDGDGRCLCETSHDLCTLGYCLHRQPDNCPLVPNSGQENTNSHSEEAHEAETLGDVCEPVPTPRGRIDTSQVEECRISLCDVGEPDESDCWHYGEEYDPLPFCDEHIAVWALCENILRDRFSVDPLRSYDRANTGSSAGVGPAETSWRFCQHNLALGIRCDDPTLDLQDELLSQDASSAQETPATRWHRITVQRDSYPWTSVGPDETISRSYVLRVDQQSSVAWRWLYEQDFDRWTQGPNPLLLGVPTTFDLQGGLWLHADTMVGQPGGQNVGTGIHLAAEPELANDHVLGEGDFGYFEPVETWCYACVKVGVSFGDAPPASLDADEPGAQGLAAAAPVSTPYLLWRPVTARETEPFRRPRASEREASVVLGLGLGHAAALVPGLGAGCNAQVVDERFGSAARAAFATAGLRWVNAAEPVAELGHEPSFPLAVALSADGASLLHTLSTDGSRLLAPRDELSCGDAATPCSHCASGWCSAVPGSLETCCLAPCTSSEECASRYCDLALGVCAFPPLRGSPHALGYAAVLTRMRRGVFVVGGADPDSGEPTGEVWFSPLGAREWQRVQMGLAPDRVLAATYSFASDALYVLDETGAEAEGDGPSGGHGHGHGNGHGHGGSAPAVRLWEHRLATGQTHLVGSWPRSAAERTYSLVVDRDGGLLLAVSTPPPGGQHLVARFAVSGPSLVLDGISHAPKALALPPVVDLDGYTFVLRDGPEPDGITMVRSAQLGLHPANWAALGSLF